MIEKPVFQATINTANFLETEEFDLFTEEITRLDDDGGSASPEPEFEDQPRLTLVHGEEEEPADPHKAVVEEAAEVDDGSPPITTEMVENGQLFEITDIDHSAVEDIVLSNPLAEEEEKAALDEIASNLVVTPTRPTTPMAAPLHAGPSRTGNARLVTERLSWKPGDPFGGRSGSVVTRFRWEVMLTAASITALCGLGCIWLLRSILA